MPDHDTLTAMDRIDAAIARIDAAVARRAEATEHLRQRHEALRARMQEAVDALDSVIAREGQR